MDRRRIVHCLRSAPYRLHYCRLLRTPRDHPLQLIELGLRVFFYRFQSFIANELYLPLQLQFQRFVVANQFLCVIRKFVRKKKKKKCTSSLALIEIHVIIGNNFSSSRERQVSSRGGMKISPSPIRRLRSRNRLNSSLARGDTWQLRS